eukprot:Stramenopile-MAST_4_protein_852
MLELAIVSATWAAWHFLIEGVEIMLLKPCIGLKSFNQGFLATSFWTILTFVCFFFSGLLRQYGHGNNDTAAAFIVAGWNFILAIFYASIAWFPSSMFPFHRRPAARIYGNFYAVIRFFGFIASVLNAVGGVETNSELNFWFETVLFTLGQPFTLLVTFQNDSKYWRGELSEGMGASRSSDTVVGNDAASTGEHRADLEDSITQPLIGQSWSRRASTAVIEEVSVTASSTRAPMLIDFADLSLNEKCILGSGGSARVYKGKYKGEKVAVKLIYCIELTREVVHNFFSEARILKRISGTHPNIVSLKGVCVAPPALGMVLELCDGSLFDELQMKRSRNYMFCLSYFLQRAIQCTRAVLYLHRRNPPLCHCDIKSLNFLLKDGVIKLADMGMTGNFEEQRRSTSGTGASTKSVAVAAAKSYGSAETDVQKFGDMKGILPSRVLTNRRGSTAMQQNFVGTAQWTAPEIIDGGQSSLSGDVYSLGIVLWEILTAEVPYDNIQFSSQVTRHVLEGGRPCIPKGTDVRIGNLIERCWEPSPYMRVTCEHVMKSLVSMLETGEERHSVLKDNIIAELGDPLNELIKGRYYNAKYFKDCFVGSDVVSFLCDRFATAIKTRDDAVQILGELLEDGVFQHVVNEHSFKDEFLFYQFRN